MFSKDSSLAVALILLVLVGLPVLLLWIRDRVRGWLRRKIPDQIRADVNAYRERLLHPAPPDVEARIGGRLPKRLIDLYKDQATVLSKKVEIRPPGISPKEFGEWIEDFLPLDLKSQSFCV